MRHEEALLFYTYDGTAPLEGPRFVFHTALGDTGGRSTRLVHRLCIQ